MDLPRRAEQGGVGLCGAAVRAARAGAEEDTETRKGVILEYQGRRLTLMVSPARYLDDSGTIEIGELDVFLEERLAITVSRGEDLNLDDVEHSLQESPDLSRLGQGPSCARSSIG